MKITDLEDGIIDAIAEAKNKKRIPDSVPKGQRRSDYVKDFQEMLCKCIREKESFSMLNPSTEKHIFEESGHTRCVVDDKEKYRKIVNDFVNKFIK